MPEPMPDPCAEPAPTWQPRCPPAPEPARPRLPARIQVSPVDFAAKQHHFQYVADLFAVMSRL